MPHLAEQLALLFGQTKEAILDGKGFDLATVPEMAMAGPVILPAAGEAAISLRSLRGGETEILSLESRKGKTFTTPQVLAAIGQRLKENRPVWVLFGAAESGVEVPKPMIRKPKSQKSTSRK